MTTRSPEVTAESPDSLRATEYTLRDSTDHRTVFSTGHDFQAKGVGATGDGLMPLVFSHPSVTVDPDSSGYTPSYSYAPSTSYIPSYSYTPSYSYMPSYSYTPTYSYAPAATYSYGYSPGVIYYR